VIEQVSVLSEGLASGDRIDYALLSLAPVSGSTLNFWVPTTSQDISVGGAASGVTSRHASTQTQAQVLCLVDRDDWSTSSVFTCGFSGFLMPVK
jgi:hypothetical protein